MKQLIEYIEAGDNAAKYASLPNQVLDEYSWQCGNAYNQLFVELIQFFDQIDLPLDYQLNDRNNIKLVSTDKIDPLIMQQTLISFYQITGRCGQKIGTAKKIGQKALFLAVFLDAREKGLDTTIVTMQQAAKRVFNRGVDKIFLQKHFATPGRKVPNLSRIFTNDVQRELYEQHIKILDEKNTLFAVYAIEIRTFYAQQWKPLWETRKQA